MHPFGHLDTLEYLAKTSRIPRIGALFRKALESKPIILFANGDVKPLGGAPGRFRRAVGRLLNLMEERLVGGASLRSTRTPPRKAKS